jgi:hypothetical protein
MESGDTQPNVNGRLLQSGQHVFDAPYGSWYLRGFDK